MNNKHFARDEKVFSYRLCHLWLFLGTFLGFGFLACVGPQALAEIVSAEEVLAEEAYAVVTTELDASQAVAVDSASIKPIEPDENLDAEIAEQTLKEINVSLRRAIEENKKLLEEKSALESEVKKTRGEVELLGTRLRNLTVQRDQTLSESQVAKELQLRASEDLENLRKEFSEKEKKYKDQIEHLTKEADRKQMMEQVVPWLSENPERFFGPSATPVDQLNMENSRLKVDSVKLIKETKDGLSDLTMNLDKITGKIEMLQQENKRLRVESAKQHYNMGNVFFEQRRYKQALQEYKRVAELIPQDPAAHFNLAFVSGEFMEDYETALVHYEKYLLLNPGATDADMVRTKIIEAQLKLGTSLGPPLDSKISERAKEIERF